MKDLALAIHESNHRLWIEPELQRRRAAGTLPPDFLIHAYQVLIDGDGVGSTVRFNDECRFVAQVEFAPGKVPGEVLYLPDVLRDVLDVYQVLLQEHEANYGHITAFAYAGGKWCVHFDARCNGARAGDIVRVVPQFLDSAEDALARDHLHPFVESLWSAVELTAKGQLMMIFARDLAGRASHGKIGGSYNQWNRHGLIPSDFVALYNRLSNLRHPARYLDAALKLTVAQASEMLADARRMFADLESEAPVRVMNVEGPQDGAEEWPPGSLGLVWGSAG